MKECVIKQIENKVWCGGYMEGGEAIEDLDVTSSERLFRHYMLYIFGIVDMTVFILKYYVLIFFLNIYEIYYHDYHS